MVQTPFPASRSMPPLIVGATRQLKVAALFDGDSAIHGYVIHDARPVHVESACDGRARRRCTAARTMHFGNKRGRQGEYRDEHQYPSSSLC